MIEWLVANREWVFSGVGVVVLTAIFSCVRYIAVNRKKDLEISAINQQQKSGMLSKSFQIGTININQDNGGHK